MRSELNYAGKNLSEFGMWFDNSKVYKKPAKRFIGYDIPARNGTLYQSENKFNNVVIEFDCFIKDNFDQNYHDLVNFLNSFDTYQKLINSYNTDMFRMALFHEAIEVDTGQFLKDGRFKLFFDCKPQEYYADGAEFERIAPHSDIYTGNPAELVNEGESSVISLRVALNPVQNLNGYDSPWIGDGGKNLLPTGSFTISGGGTTTATFATDGVHISGTKANGIWADYLVTNGGTLKANTSYVLSLGITNTSVPWSLTLRNGGTQLYEVTANNGSGTLTITPTADVTFDRWRLTIRSNDALAVNSVVKPMLRLSSTTATYEPYANICPIYASNGKNLLPYDAWKTVGIRNGTAVWENNGVTLTATANDAYTQWNNTEYPTGARIPVTVGRTYVLTWESEATTANDGEVYIFPNGGTTGMVVTNARHGTLSYTAGNGITYVSIRLGVSTSGKTIHYKNVMIRDASITDATYQPYQSIMVTRTGKNLFNGQFAYHNADKYSPVLDGETYTVSSKSTGAHQINMQYITKTNTYYGDRKIVSEGDTFGKTTVTIPTDVKGVLIYVNGDASNSQHTAYDTQIELGSTATEYEPYQGNTYTIDLNGTRYGGTVDLATGVLSLTYGLVTFDGSSDENWSLQSGRRCAIGNALPNYKVVSGTDRTIGALSNLFKEDTPNNTWTSEIGFSIEAGGILAVRQLATNTMTVADFKTFLQSNPMQICYPLHNQQTVQLTPQQISLLTGTNYISSSGEVTVTTSTPLILKNPSPMTAKPVFKFNNITAPFTVSANGETIISFQNAIRLVKAGVVNNMFFNATGTNLNIQKQGTPNYEETSFLINSGWLPAGRYFLATMAIGNLEVTSMDGTHLYSSGGTFTLTDMTQVKVWYVITPDASTPQNFNLPIFLRPMGTLYVDSELMDCYMLDGDTAYSFNECVSLPKDFLQLDERTVMTMTSGAVGFIAPNWWRL